jgi:hypothetical protein
MEVKLDRARSASIIAILLRNNLNKSFHHWHRITVKSILSEQKNIKTTMGRVHKLRKLFAIYISHRTLIEKEAKMHAIRHWSKVNTSHFFSKQSIFNREIRRVTNIV